MKMSAPPQKPKLLAQVRTVAALRHLSGRTAEAYTYWIKRFIIFHNRKHPSLMNAPEIRAFLGYLAQSQNVAASTQNQALNAIISSTAKSSKQNWDKSLTSPTPKGQNDFQRSSPAPKSERSSITSTVPSF